MAMIMILRTTIHKNPPQLLKKYVPELLPVYWKVFNNNNNKTLRNFFHDPFVKYLWNKYPKEYIGEYFSKLDEKQRKLIRKDIIKLKLKEIIQI